MTARVCASDCASCCAATISWSLAASTPTRRCSESVAACTMASTRGTIGGNATAVNTEATALSSLTSPASQ
jgi:hypothetical protein